MRRLHDAALALSSDGSLLLNVTHTDGSLTPEACLERALSSGGRVFIGVELGRDEANRLRTFLHDGLDEAASRIAAAMKAGGRLP